MNIDRLFMSGSMTACPRVDWLYRSIMWLYQHLGLRRLIIWYRNLED